MIAMNKLENKPPATNILLQIASKNKAIPSKKKMTLWVNYALEKAKHDSMIPRLSPHMTKGTNVPKVTKEYVIPPFNRGIHQGTQTELGIRIVNNAESQKLNEHYRHKSGPTNVLSFPSLAVPGINSHYLGDLVIAAPLVAQEAQLQNKAIEAHWAHLIVHGVLHLIGYDHIESQDASVMEALEILIMTELGYPNPY